MDMREFLKSTDMAGRQRLAKAVNTSVAYLYMIAGGHRKPSPKLCIRLIAADSRFTKYALRPDIWGTGADSREVA